MIEKRSKLWSTILRAGFVNSQVWVVNCRIAVGKSLAWGLDWSEKNRWSGLIGAWSGWFDRAVGTHQKPQLPSSIHPDVNGYLAIDGVIIITRPSGKKERIKAAEAPLSEQNNNQLLSLLYFHYYLVMVVSRYSLYSFHNLNGEEVIVSGVVGRIFQSPTKDLDNELDVEARRIEINVFLFSHNVGQNKERLCKWIRGKDTTTVVWNFWIFNFWTS